MTSTGDIHGAGGAPTNIGKPFAKGEVLKADRLESMRLGIVNGMVSTPPPRSEHVEMVRLDAALAYDATVDGFLLGWNRDDGAFEDISTNAVVDVYNPYPDVSYTDDQKIPVVRVGGGVVIPLFSGTPIRRFTLNAVWSAGVADADILLMDGTDTTVDADVLDPLGIFASLGIGDAGICILQGGGYYVIQALCPA